MTDAPPGDDWLPDPPRVSPMVDWTVYDSATGRVMRYGHAAPEDAALQASGEGEAMVLARIDARTDYLPGGVVTARPTLGIDRLAIVADGEDTATLLLPGPFVAKIDGVAYDLEDALGVASDMPASYRIEIDRFPFRRFAAEIVAT